MHECTRLRDEGWVGIALDQFVCRAAVVALWGFVEMHGVLVHLECNSETFVPFLYVVDAQSVLILPFESLVPKPAVQARTDLHH
jgi:hypothetical protein